MLFNDILNPKMAFYDLSLSSKHLSRIIADCYQQLGRRETIELLDRMKDIGFRESTRSRPELRHRRPADADQQGEGAQRHGEGGREASASSTTRGNITEVERYNKVIDLWTHARDEITKQMMDDLQERPPRRAAPYLNPIFLMAHSGARGGVEQIRQLAGMRGLMAKPTGTDHRDADQGQLPRRAVSVLEYFSSTHGARKGLADTALKTADSGYLTRKLADVAQNVVITMHDCGTTQGITKGVVYKGEEIERPLSESIRGRVSRNTITTRSPDEVIVSENEMITWEAARKIEQLGLDKILVRSPMTCQAPLGVCRLCYGMDLATGTLVEEGMAVGIIAAQSIGEPGTQLTMRTFHIGGVVKREMVESEVKAKKAGMVKFERINAVINDKGERIALTRNGEVLDHRAQGTRRWRAISVPNGADAAGRGRRRRCKPGQVLCKWDPHITPILAERRRQGPLRRDRRGRNAAQGARHGDRRRALGHHGAQGRPAPADRHRGRPRPDPDDVYYMPEKAYLEVRDGQKVSAGTLLAKTPREVAGTQDITGGLPRVTEIFEARTPRDPAKMAEVAGMVRLGEKKRGKRTIFIQPVDDAGKPVGEEREHQVPPGKHLRVHTGDHVKEGDRLVFGPLVPHEILKISGIEEVQKYLVQRGAGGLPQPSAWRSTTSTSRSSCRRCCAR